MKETNNLIGGISELEEWQLNLCPQGFQYKLNYLRLKIMYKLEIWDIEVFDVADFKSGINFDVSLLWVTVTCGPDTKMLKHH